MEQFEERLARLSELGPDELVALEQELVAAFEAADSSGDIETMQRIADAIDAVRAATQPAATTEAPAEEPAMAASAAEDGENGTDTEEDASSDDEEAPEVPTPDDQPAEQEAPEAEAETPEVNAEETPAEEPVAEAPVEETTEEVEAPAAETETAPEAEVETEVPAEAEAEAPVSEEAPEPEPALASGEPTNESEESVDTNITADDVPEENTPTPAVPAVTIRAGGDVPGYTAGSAMPDMDAVVEALAAKVNTMRNVRGDGEHIVVASMRVEEDVPEERMLRQGDSMGNSRKIRELLQDQDVLATHESLTAAAWCAPRAPIYNVPTIGTTGRPVADSLPTFTADRGGITWMQPPGVGVGGVGLWRHDGTSWESFTDPAGTGTAGTTKPCATIVCGTEQSLDVDAITLCLNFQNMMTRAFPEWVRANTDLVMVQHARFAEQVLLSRMFGVVASGAANPGTQVGAARDFFIIVRTAAANFRWERRLGSRAPLQLLAPSWVAEAMAADLDLQQPGDNTLGTSLGEVNALFNEINVDPIWFIDDVPGHPAFSASFSYPATAHWMLYPTGTFLRLDSGELNIGVVRDMDHVQANTYSEFSETFETVAYMGPADPYMWVVRGATNIDLAGSSGAARVITIS